MILIKECKVNFLVLVIKQSHIVKYKFTSFINSIMNGFKIKKIETNLVGVLLYAVPFSIKMTCRENEYGLIEKPNI